MGITRQPMVISILPIMVSTGIKDMLSIISIAAIRIIEIIKFWILIKVFSFILFQPPFDG